MKGIRSRMSIDSSDRDKLVVREQANQIFNNVSGSAVTQIIVAALFYTLFNASIDSKALLFWAISLSVIAISRLVLAQLYKKKAPKEVKNWLNAFTLLTLLLGITWACFSLFFLTVDDVSLKYLFFVAICGMVAGAVPILAAWTPAYYANTLPQLIVWPSVLLYSHSTVNYFIAISFTVYCLMLIKLHSNANHSIRTMYQLQYKNDDLVAELNAEIERREQLIEIRTQELNNSLIEKTAIANNKLVGIVIVKDRKIQWANATFETMMGYKNGETIGCLTRQFYAKETDYQAIGEAYKSILDGIIKDELEFKCKDGKTVWVSMKGSVLDANKGTSLWVFVDISERMQALEALRLSSRVFSETHDGIIITDANQKIIDVNPAFCEITEYSHEEVIGQTPNILSSGKQSSEFYIEMWKQINEQGHWQGEVWNRRKSGEVYAELLTISELKNNNGKRSHFVGVFSDITKSKLQQEKLKQLVHYDVLTNLPNHTLLSDRFRQAVAHSKRSGTLLAVCFLDLDSFKDINDNFSHEVGDELLIEVGKRILACIREEDTAARLGGDEFALLLGDIVSYEQCEQMMDRIHHSIAEPYYINDVLHQLTVSSGIAFYPNNKGDVDTLLRYADQAMYLAKQAGRNRYQWFNTEQEQKNSDKYNRLSEIEQALNNNEFQLYYQPKVNMVTGDVYGVEALIRWIHPNKGLIPPLEFLPTVAETNLEIQLGEWVTNAALAQLELWQQQGINLEVSINITSHHLLSDTFLSQLETILDKYPTVNAQSLQLEILESSVLSDVKAITDIINRCQNRLGLSFALDDFGTGYSSLTHLRNLPAGTVKIDQSFVRDLLDDPNAYAIIDGVIGLADSFNRNIIAEGVETTNHGLMLLLMGCEQAQGYGVAKPMPANEFAAWFSNYTPNYEWQLCGKELLSKSKKECDRKLFRLTTEHWKNSFVENIILGAESIVDWPVMDAEQCPCGFWIKRAMRAQLFEDSDLKQLKKTHEKVHLIADGIYRNYQVGQINEARNGLKDLHIAFDEMSAVLGP